ncbi:MAG: hypothetical protein ACTSSP_00110 [Candidatus Asgardarchaeia archaeon]
MHSFCMTMCKRDREEHKMLLKDISVYRDQGIGKWFVDLPMFFDFQGHYTACCKHDAISQCIHEYEKNEESKKEGF